MPTQETKAQKVGHPPTSIVGVTAETAAAAVALAKLGADFAVFAYGGAFKCK
jgi:hypothetical protein